MRMSGRLTRLFWASFMILCYLVWNFHSSVLPIKSLQNSFLQKLSESGPTYANFVTSVSYTDIMLNIVYMFLFFIPLYTGFWLDRSSTPELALLLAMLSLLSEVSAHCSSCPYMPHGLADNWHSSFFWVYSYLIYYILPFCIIEFLKGKKNQFMFSLFFTSFSEYHV